MDPKTATSAILRRLAVALKTYVLYPPPSTVTDRAVAELMEVLRDSIQEHGPFSVRVSRRSFHFNDATFKDPTSANLAFQLFARKVIALQIGPGVDAAELTTLIASLRQTPAALQAAGGLAAVLRDAGVRAVRVREIMFVPGAAEDEQADPALWDLVGDGEHLSPESLQAVVAVLRGGPASIASLLERTRTILVDAGDGHAHDWSHVGFDLIKRLDRVIAAQPADERPHFYEQLAAAIVLLDDPVRAPLEQTLVAQERTDRTARFLLDRMSEQRLGQLVPRGALEGDDSDAGRVGPDPVVDPEMQIARAQNAAKGTAPAVDAFALQYEDSVEDLRREAQVIDEASVARETFATLIDLLDNEADEAEILEAIVAIEARVPELVTQQEFRLLRAALAALVAAAERAGVREQTVARLADRLVKDRALEALLDILWANHGGKVADDVRGCLILLAEGVTIPLMHLLGDESRLPVRRMLCDMIIVMGPDRVADVGLFSDDARWYLARNVAYILGRLGDARGVPHVARLAVYPDYRVRSEAAAALARIGGPEADAHLAAMLGDADERVRLKAILSLSDGGVVLARDKLVALLEQPDPFHRQFHIKQQAITALARAGVEDALPVLVRMARRRFGFGWRSRALRAMAADAVDEIRGRGIAVGRPVLTVGVQAWNQ